MYHNLRNYRIISVMFWAFPYLLWQAFGNWSGFVVGLIVAIILTVMAQRQSACITGFAR